MEHRSELMTALGKQLPPWLIVLVNELAGIPLERWMVALTIVYTALQIFVLARDKVFQRPAAIELEHGEQ